MHRARPDFVYVGRGGFFGLKASPWGNPFRIGVDGNREQVVERYRKHLVDSGLAKRVGELRGSTLLCHCSAKEAFHADVLVEFPEGAPRPAEEPRIAPELGR